jgi:predicted TIM-barrel enzyme
MYLDFRQHHKGLDNLNSEVATDSALRTVGFLNGKKIHLLRHGQAIHKSVPLFFDIQMNQHSVQVSSAGTHSAILPSPTKASLKPAPYPSTFNQTL